MYVPSTKAYAILETPSISTPKHQEPIEERRTTAGEVSKREADFKKPRNVSKRRREMQSSGDNPSTPQRGYKSHASPEHSLMLKK
jgi:hypothetical protein